MRIALKTPPHGKQLTYSIKKEVTDMKTTGQDATPKPASECATCGTALNKDEYELCEPCKRELQIEYEQDRGRGRGDRDEEW